MKALAVTLWLSAALVAGSLLTVRPTLPCASCACSEPVLVAPEVEIAAQRVIRANRRAGAVPLDDEGTTTSSPISEACRDAFAAFEDACP